MSHARGQREPVVELPRAREALTDMMGVVSRGMETLTPEDWDGERPARRRAQDVRRAALDPTGPVTRFAIRVLLRLMNVVYPVFKPIREGRRKLNGLERTA